MTHSKHDESAPVIEGWSREGFVGARASAMRSQYSPDYLSVKGPHAPRRFRLADLPSPDEADPEALPVVFATAASGLRLSLSRRAAAMPFVYRNVEADEVHFIQSGEIEFRTDFGVIVGAPGDFVYLPRCVAYCAIPRATLVLDLIAESPGALKFDTPAPIGMIQFGQHLVHATPDASFRNDAPKTLLLRSHDDITIFEKGYDPLAVVRQTPGPSPVWKLNLAHINPVVYWPHGGPPSHFLASPGNELLFYTLSARPGGRPPVHVNADYDEIIHYFRGPDPWGGIDEPGTWTCVPKGVPHHGPSEDMPRGFLAWMLETRTTLRLTPAGRAASDPMDTATYGRHVSAGDNRK